MVHARIRYVDGFTIDVPAVEWRDVWAEGIDFIEVGVGEQRVHFSGHSMYWLYPDGDNWVVGAASFYDNPKSEITIAPDGTQTERTLEHVPDLKHRDVKLGWWWLTSG